MAKYDQNGVLLELRRDGGTGSENGYGISAFPDGSYAVIGVYTRRSFTTTEFIDDEETIVLDFVDGGDVFLARYNADGSL